MNNSGKLFSSINDDIITLVDIILQLNDNGQLDQFILDNVKNIASTSFFVDTMEDMLYVQEVKHFLESVFMYLKGYIEKDDLTNSWFKMYDKKQEYYRYIWYNWYLSHNILLPL